MPGTATHMTDIYLAIEYRGHAMFTAQLGLTVAELSDGHDSQHAVIDKVKRIAVQAADAYVAREVLSSPAAALITRQTRTMLRGTVRRSRPRAPATGSAATTASSIATAATTLAASLASAGTSATGNEALPEPVAVIKEPTASVFIFCEEPDGRWRTALVWHPRLGCWLPPGAAASSHHSWRPVIGNHCWLRRNAIWMQPICVPARPRRPARHRGG